LADVLRALEAALPAIVTVWLTGVLLFSLRLLMQWQRARRLLAKDSAPACEPWLSAAKRIGRALGVRRAVRVLESAAVRVPAAFGWLRPVIVLPASAIAGLSPAQLEMILAHELAHIRRHDFLVNLLQAALETLLFYHPAVWWISRRVRIERENCCDDLAVAVCGNPVQYARALARLEELRAEPLPFAVSADGGSLLDRIRRLVRRPVSVAAPVRGVAAAAVLAGMLLALAGPSLSAIAKRQAPSAVAAGEPAVEDAYAWSAAPATGGASSPKSGAQAKAKDKAAKPGAGSAAATEETPTAGTDPDPDPNPDAAPAATSGGKKIKLTLDELLELRSQNLTPSQLLELRFLFPGIPTRDAANLSNMGATPEWIQELRATGLDVNTPRDASSLAGVGVTPDYVREMRAAGMKVETAKDAHALASVGVTSEYVREMRAAGMKVETVREAQNLAAVGVTPEYIAEMRSSGLAVASAKDASGLAAVGVTADFIREMRSAGMPVSSAKDAQGLAAVGVSADYIRAMRATGLKLDAADEVRSLAAVGVQPDWVREMRKAGVDLRDASDAHALQVQNITPEFVRRLWRAGYKDLSVEELCRLGVAGLSGSFVEEMSKYRTK
jgi:beta-lactamase regulating signal transducer with metallopeptidase domain